MMLAVEDGRQVAGTGGGDTAIMPARPTADQAWETLRSFGSKVTLAQLVDAQKNNPADPRFVWVLCYRCLQPPVVNGENRSSAEAALTLFFGSGGVPTRLIATACYALELAGRNEFVDAQFWPSALDRNNAKANPTSQELAAVSDLCLKCPPPSAARAVEWVDAQRRALLAEEALRNAPRISPEVANITLLVGEGKITEALVAVAAVIQQNPMPGPVKDVVVALQRVLNTPVASVGEEEAGITPAVRIKDLYIEFARLNPAEAYKPEYLEMIGAAFKKAKFYELGVQLFTVLDNLGTGTALPAQALPAFANLLRWQGDYVRALEICTRGLAASPDPITRDKLLLNQLLAHYYRNRTPPNGHFWRTEISPDSQVWSSYVLFLAQKGLLTAASPDYDRMVSDIDARLKDADGYDRKNLVNTLDHLGLELSAAT